MNTEAAMTGWIFIACKLSHSEIEHNMLMEAHLATSYS